MRALASFAIAISLFVLSDENNSGRDKKMDLQLAEAIIEACAQKGVKTELQENYSPSWMRGQKTIGVVIENGDLAQVITAIISNPHLFIEGELPRFDIKNDLRASRFRLSLILF